MSQYDSPGVRLSEPDTFLTARAADYLKTGSADSVDLISYVCNLPGAPKVVAEHLAEAMFMGRPDFARGLDGKWSLVKERQVPRDYFEPANDNSPRLSEMSFVVVDTETTGTSPFWGHRMTEFAAVVVEHGEIVEIFESLINPRRPIPSMVSALTGITSSMVKDAPVFREIAPRVESLLEGRVFVAHNVGFDWRFVESELENATGRYIDGHKLCTVKMAKKVLPNLQRRSLDHVANFCGVEIVNRHRAGGDAIATAHCLIYMLRRAEGMGIERWTDLQRLIRMRRKAKRTKRPSAMPGPISKDTTA